MALKHLLSDASYWVYDRVRHKAAFESAAQPGTAADFSGLDGHKYALLVTFRRDGAAVPTPVWFATPSAACLAPARSSGATAPRIVGPGVRNVGLIAYVAAHSERVVNDHDARPRPLAGIRMRATAF